MARNRMLKKDFFGDPKVGSLPLGCRLLFQSLWVFADDSGHGISDVRLLKAQCFPYDPDITPEHVSAWFELLCQAGMVREYEIAGQQYFEVVNFSKHQIINRPSQFCYPKPTHRAVNEYSLSTPTVLTEDRVSTPAPLTDERESKRGKGKNKGKGKKDGAGAPGHFENRKTPDARFDPLKAAYVDAFERKSPNLKAPFEASDGKMLNDLLSRQPQATCDQLAGWLNNAFASDDVPPLRPRFRLREFCAHAEKYANGPLKRGGAAIRSAAVDGVQASRLEGLVR